MMAAVPHVISGLGLRKFQADGFLLTRVYKHACCCSFDLYFVQSARKNSNVPLNPTVQTQQYPYRLKHRLRLALFRLDLLF